MVERPLPGSAGRGRIQIEGRCQPFDLEQGRVEQLRAQTDVRREDPTTRLAGGCANAAEAGAAATSSASSKHAVRRGAWFQRTAACWNRTPPSFDCRELTVIARRRQLRGR